MNRVIALLGLVLCCGSVLPGPVTDLHVEIEHELSSTTDPMAAALMDLQLAIARAQQQLQAEPAFDTELDQVDGYRHLLRSLVKGIEDGVLQNPDYPYFRILDFWLREGGDNPDQRYAFSPVRGGEHYRIWGNMGSAKRIELQLYAGRAWDGSGRSLGYLNFENIHVSDDGEFEIWLSPKPHGGNWLANPAEATDVFIRHVYDNWDNTRPGSAHIDRIGWEGKRQSAQSPTSLAEGIRQASDMFTASAATWPAVVQRFEQRLPANRLSLPHDTYSQGGAKGRWMSSGHFDLSDGDALVIVMPQTAAAYQAIQLTDRWFASLEYANNVSSLNTIQSDLAPDGRFYYVLSATDPGYPNWLDTGGHLKGTMLLRWDGLTEALAEAQQPIVHKLPLPELGRVIPGEPTVTEDERKRIRAARRRHLQTTANR